MNPLTVLAKIKPQQLDDLARILSGIDRDQAHNPLMRLREDSLTHCARWAIITEPPNEPRLLFASEFDGDVDAYLDALLDETPGLDEIWGRCEGYTGRDGFKSFIRAHAYPTQAFYIAFRDETATSICRKIVVRCRLEAALDCASTESARLLGMLAAVPAPRKLWRTIRSCVLASGESFRRNWLEIALAIVKPLSQLGQTTHYSPVGSVGWDSLTPRAQRLRNIDGQMITVTTIKPGRYWRVRIAVALNEFLARFGWAPGNFADVGTLHSFRWVLIDKGKRLIFLSVYDGSWQNYMGDFIDKIVWALDGVYNNTLDYPVGGMADVVPFQRWILNHQYEPQLFYRAYPEETVLNLIRDRDINNTLASVLWDGFRFDSTKAATILERA